MAPTPSSSSSSSSRSSSRVSRQFRLLIPLLLFFLTFLHYVLDLSLVPLTKHNASLYFEVPTAVLRSTASSSSSSSGNNNNNTSFLGAHTSENVTSTLSSTSISSPRYAYAFLVAGCNPDDGRYRGFLYSVLLAIYNLHQGGSKADFVVMIQMAVKSSVSTLPEHDMIPFVKLNHTIITAHHGDRTHNSSHKRAHPSMITFQYLPKPSAADNFYRAMMSKFVILNWTHYDRVLYLDADVVPYCNLDYFFELSHAGILQPNVILAAGSSPINGGTFMIRPGLHDYDRLQDILDRQQAYAIQMSTAHRQKGDRTTTTTLFDDVQGWGHAIQPTHDYWMTIKKVKQTKWTFHAAFADQGLLYHWVKYVQQNVSIIIFDIVEHWTSSTTSDALVPHLQSNVSAFEVPGLGCHGRWRIRRIPRNPYVDFWHHMGDVKPWELNTIPDDVESPEQTGDARQIWFHFFRKVMRALNMTTSTSSEWNLTNMFPIGSPSLGRNPYRREILSMARARGRGGVVPFLKTNQSLLSA